MSKLEAIRNRKPYTNSDGTEMCFSHQAANMSVYEPCQFQQLATARGGGGLGSWLALIVIVAIGLTWGGSYVTARQSQYDSLFTAIKRGMKS